MFLTGIFEIRKNGKNSGEQVLNAFRAKKEQNMSETERCVCCGCDTGILKTEPIDLRRYYVLGCGQLCVKCYKELYVRPEPDGSLLVPEEEI